MPRLCYLLLLLCLPCSAEVYTYLDEAGNRVYTDRPLRDNAEQVQLAPLNELPPPLIRPPAALLPQQAPAPSYVLLRIITPEPDAVIRDMTGNLIVTANSDPALLPGHSYRLLLDGAAVGEPGRSPVFPLENLDRGEHQLRPPGVGGEDHGASCKSDVAAVNTVCSSSSSEADAGACRPRPARHPVPLARQVSARRAIRAACAEKSPRSETPGWY